MTIGCQQVTELKEAYVDNLLRSDERVAVETHLALCAACSTRIVVSRRIKEGIGPAMKSALGNPTPSRQQVAAMQAQLEQRISRSPGMRLGRSSVAVSMLTVVLTAAAVLGAVLQTGLLSRVLDFEPKPVSTPFAVWTQAVPSTPTSEPTLEARPTIFALSQSATTTPFAPGLKELPAAFETPGSETNARRVERPGAVVTPLSNRPALPPVASRPDQNPGPPVARPNTPAPGGVGLPDSRLPLATHTAQPARTAAATWTIPADASSHPAVTSSPVTEPRSTRTPVMTHTPEPTGTSRNPFTRTPIAPTNTLVPDRTVAPTRVGTSTREVPSETPLPTDTRRPNPTRTAFPTRPPGTPPPPSETRPPHPTPPPPPSETRAPETPRPTRTRPPHTPPPPPPSETRPPRPSETRPPHPTPPPPSETRPPETPRPTRTRPPQTPPPSETRPPHPTPPPSGTRPPVTPPPTHPPRPSETREPCGGPCTPIPTNTPVPIATDTDTPEPTPTGTPTYTPTPEPTYTDTPTSTPTAMP